MMRLLFVDDEPNILQGIKRMLRSKRDEWEMEFATSGHDALVLLGQKHFDAIITDIRMPHMDGIELLEQVSQNYPGMIRFILSGQAKRDTVLRSIGPMHQYLSKPTDADELRSAIERAINLRSILMNDTLIEVVSRIRSLPSLPQIYYELVEHLDQDQPSITRISEIISKDISMMAKILHLVNSSYFAFSHHVTSITQAVTLLGIDTVRVLVISMHLFSKIPAEVLEQIPLSHLWDHSLNSATIAREILKRAGTDKNSIEDSYMGALLHDIGILIMANAFTGMYVTFIDKARKHGIPFHSLEKEEFGVTHAEVGGYLLGIWGLPNPIIETVSFHHEPWKLGDISFDHVGAVYVANILEHEVTENKLFNRHVPFNDEYINSCGISEQIAGWREMATSLTREHQHGE